MRFLFIKSLIFLIATIITMAHATTIRVPEDFSTIQQAIDASSDGDTVLVAQNTYYEDINFHGKNILLTSYFLFAHDLSYISNTVINGSQPVHPDTASCVLFISGETSNAILQGFTLTGGKGTRWPDVHIGGFYREGGGILMELSSPTIQFNLITDNQAIDKTNCTSAGGGAIRCGDGDPMIQNNVIVNNQGLYGGGIVMNFSTGTIRNNLIMNNSGGEDYGGSGIWSYAAGTTIITNNTIMYNHSVRHGGGIQIWSTSATIKNNIIRNNTSDLGGDQIYLISSPSTGATYNNVEGGWTGTGNIDADPYFENQVFILSDTSTCVDAGDPDTVYNDPEGSPGMAAYPSKGTVRNDMGAYGGPNSAELSSFIITSIEDKRSGYIPADFQLEQNYPNPFNPTTTIQYAISSRRFVSITVYDLLGCEVATLVNEELSAGVYKVTFDASDLSSGVYFYQLKVLQIEAPRKEFISTKKFILLK